jgi:hypothetical protein
MGRVQVSDAGVNGIQGSGSNPSVAVDAKGSIYYAWVAEDRLPYVATSRDAGKTWSEPIAVGLPGLDEANLFTLEVGAAGKIAFAFMGSDNSGFQECRPDCGGARAKTTWNGYLGMSADIFSKNPTFFTATVNDPSDPMKVGTCGPGRCGDAVLDFLDVVIDPQGIPSAAFVDACVKCTLETLSDIGNEGLFARCSGGPRLR